MPALSKRPGGPEPAPPIDWAAELARHDRWLRTVVFARLREAQAVEDVLQEIALAAVKQAAPLNDATKTAPWLYRLAIRHVLLYRRQAGRRRKLHRNFAGSGLAASQDAPSGDPLQWLTALERAQLVRDALTRLPRRDAEILLLKYTENWSYRDLSDHLGLSQSAVEARLHRARARLRAELVPVAALTVE